MYGFCCCCLKKKLAMFLLVKHFILKFHKFRLRFSIATCVVAGEWENANLT